MNKRTVSRENFENTLGEEKKEKKKRRESVKRRFFPRSRRCYSVSRGRDYYQGIKKSLSDYVSPVPHTHTHTRSRALQTRWKSRREASTSVSRKVSAAGGSEKSWLPSRTTFPLMPPLYREDGSLLKFLEFTPSCCHHVHLTTLC